MQIERAIDLDAMRIKGTCLKSLSELLHDRIQLWEKARSLWADVRLRIRLTWAVVGFALGNLVAWLVT